MGVCEIRIPVFWGMGAPFAHQTRTVFIKNYPCYCGLHDISPFMNA